MRLVYAQDPSRPKYSEDANTSLSNHTQTSHHPSTIGRRAGWYVLIAAVFCIFGSSFAKASTYYLSPYGSDSNSGKSTSAAWISPNHALNCGDVIIAAAGTNYSASNFYTGRWGTVNCPTANNVAWLTCATFDACKINTSSQAGMWVDKSYWGVSGWEITTSASDTYGTCFIAQPNWSSPIEIHHIIFANNVANGCAQAGFGIVNHGSIGVDYLTVIGNIAYNAAEGYQSCASGISVFQPIQSDSAAGTHIYVAGNFVYDNIVPSGCGPGSPTDGNGIIFDTFDGSQGGLPYPYAAQAVAANNIVVGNGGKGVEVFQNYTGSSHATIYVTQNTSWGNLADPHQTGYGCGDVAVKVSKNTQLSGNLMSTRSATGCGGHPVYAVSVAEVDGSDSIAGNFIYGYNGYNTFAWDSPGFAFGSNDLSISPNFTNPYVPGAPNCGGTTNVPGCMASVTAGFVPQTASAQAFGYQRPVTSGSVHDPLFPRWLCTANIPSGLVSLGCI